MNRLIKSSAFVFFKTLGVYRRLRHRHRDKAVVLTYHGILPEIPRDEPEYGYRNFVTTRQFESHIQLLLKYYRPLKAADFYEPENDISRGFLITFDDGFRNNYRYAAPILQKYGIQGCFFITTSLVNTRNFIWTEELTNLILKTGKTSVTIPAVSEKPFSLETAAQREKASYAIRSQLKNTPLQARQQAMAMLREQLCDVSPELLPEEEERYLFMTWAEVRGMIDAGQLIGAHTHTHPMLSTLTEAESWVELKKSKELLEQHTGVPCLTLSYPNGEAVNFNETNIQQLRELGYRCAFTQIPLFNAKNDDLFRLRRINIPQKMPLSMVEAVLCGFVK